MHPFILRFPFGIAFFSTSICLAQITTDGTVGPRQTLTGTAMQIGAELGSTRGTNLFHSFQQFDIRTGQSATFTGSDKIQNVISRVTGGKISNIDGTLRSKVGKANVYLINPSGIVMGANARIDVPAAFHASTADEVQFNDGSRYSARDSTSSSLTIAAPESFGFLSPQPAKLIVNGSQLKVNTGKSITLSGGDIEITGTSAEKSAKLTAPGGAIRIEAVGKTGKTVAINQPSEKSGDGKLTVKNAQIDTSGDGGGLIAVRAGTAELNNAQLIAENQGAMDATGGIDFAITDLLKLDKSYLFADAAAHGKGGVIKIQAGELQLLNESLITSDSYRNSELLITDSIGAAGGVAINVNGSLIVKNGSVIQSGTVVEGNAGNVNLTVDGLLEIFNGARVSSSTFAAGNAGTITIQAGAMRIDDQSSPSFTGITSSAASNSTGNAGSINLTVMNLLEMFNGGQISSSTFAAGNAGIIAIQAGAMRIDDQSSPSFTGITSSAASNSTGNAGSINLTVMNLLEILNGGQISSSTAAKGNAGIISIKGTSVAIDGKGQHTGIFSQSLIGASGNAGDILIDANDILTLLDGGLISSETYTSGAAGEIKIRAGDIFMDGVSETVFGTGIKASKIIAAIGEIGSISLEVEHSLNLTNDAVISITNYGNTASKEGSINIKADVLSVLNESRIVADTLFDSPAGNITINANNIFLDHGEISSDVGVESTGKGGSVNVNASQLLSLSNSSKIYAKTFGFGDAGQITITADVLKLFSEAAIATSTVSEGHAGCILVQANQLYIDGQGQSTGISGNAGPNVVSDSGFNSLGHGGDVTVNVLGSLNLFNGGRISSETFTAGTAGNLSVSAGTLHIDGGNLPEVYTGIFSEANLYSSGQAGNIQLRVAGLVELVNEAEISSDTYAYGTGDAGRIDISAGQLFSSNSLINSDSSYTDAGHSGQVNLAITGSLELFNGSVISSSTWTKNNAGTVTIQAESMRLDGQGANFFTGIASTAEEPNSTGNAGNVNLTVTDLLEIYNGATITTSTWSLGDAGTLNIVAENMKIDGDNSAHFTGIISSAQPNSTGRAGGVNLMIHNLLEVSNDAEISSSTWGAGDAGTVTISVKNLQLNSHSAIHSGAAESATGKVGDVTVRADNITVNGGSRITIQSLQTLTDLTIARADGLIHLTANQIELNNGFITSESSGNVPASAIQIDGGYLWMRNSQITTSANTGNGGDIRLNPQYLILEGGFIQANTGGTGAKGGDIFINSPTLVTSYHQLDIGQLERQIFISNSERNIIQAAAPGGEQGNIDILALNLDISASIVPPSAPFGDPDDLLANVCRSLNGPLASSLIDRGNGGVPAASTAPVAVSLGGARLNQILNHALE